MVVPLVSIIIPSYNRADFISETLDSILAQSFSDFEIIFVDDGSTDQTKKILEKYSQEDKRVKYFYQTNSERAVARGYGISLAQGKYICLVDSDDIWYSDKLTKQITIMETNPQVILCYASVDRIDLSSQALPKASRQYEGFSGNVYHQLLKRNFIPSVTPMIRSEFARGASPQITEFIPYEDWDFWLRLSRQGDFYHIKEPLGAYRLHPSQSVQNVKAEKIEEVTLKVLNANTSDLLPPSPSPFIQDAYSLAYLRLAYWYILGADIKQASIKLKKSSELNTMRLLDYRWWGLRIITIIYKLAPNIFKQILGGFH